MAASNLQQQCDPVSISNGRVRAYSPLLYETNKNILRIHKPAFPLGSLARSGSHSFGQQWAFPLDQWFSIEGVSLSPNEASHKAQDSPHNK